LLWICLSVSLCLLQCMLRCRLCACCCPSLCVWALLRAASPPIGLKSAVCHMSSDTATRLVGWLAALSLCCWTRGMGVWVCVSLVRTASKSLARVLTPIALDLSLSVSCNACCDAVCVHASGPSVCVWALLRAPRPIGLKCAVCHISSDTATRPHGWLLCCAAGLVGWVCVDVHLW
jgi:hypothetical protein